MQNTPTKKYRQSINLGQSIKDYGISQFNPYVISTIAKQNPTALHINNRICNVLASIDKLYDNGNFQQASRRLLQLKEKLAFLTKSGTQFDSRLKMICYYNLGCTYQSQAFEKSNQDLINDCINNLDFAMKQAIAIIREQQQLTSTCIIKLKLFYARMLLQQFALLSQLQKHDLAFQLSKDALNLIIQIFILSKSKCKLELQQLKKRKDCGQSLGFAQNLLKICSEQLDYLSGMKKFEGILKSNSSQLQKIKQNSYFWKDNFQNNCFTFKKEIRKLIQPQNKNSSNHLLKSNSSRNFLGMKINGSTWVSQLNIGKIMRMSPVGYSYFAEPEKIALEYSSRNLIQKILLLCSVYFSIATELRYLQENNQPKNNQKPPVKNSELFHFKAIELICKYIKQDCPFADHLITSYLKHYHSTLSPIQQKPSFFQQSQIFGDIKKSTIVATDKSQQQLLEQSDYMIQKLKVQYQEDRDRFNRMTYDHKNIEINIFDSGQLQRNLIKSVDWAKKLSPNSSKQPKQKSSQKQISDSTRLKAFKKSTSSTAVKQSITLKKQKSPQIIKKSKLKRNKSSQKCLRKIITANRGMYL